MRFTLILNLIQGRRDVPHLLGRVNIRVSVRSLVVSRNRISRSDLLNACVFENFSVYNFDASVCHLTCMID